MWCTNWRVRVIIRAEWRWSCGEFEDVVAVVDDTGTFAYQELERESLAPTIPKRLPLNFYLIYRRQKVRVLSM